LIGYTEAELYIIENNKIILSLRLPRRDTAKTRLESETPRDQELVFWGQSDETEWRAELSCGEFELLAGIFMSFLSFSESLRSPFGN
jgi:hypothetical protein